MTSTATLEALAAEAYACFESFKRDGDDATLWRLKDERPEWVFDLVYAAHGDGDYLPDDWRYDCLHSALSHLADEGDPDDAHEFADGQVDVYTGSRYAWLASDLRRAGYVDGARDELGGESLDIAEQIGLGQYAEASEVFASVVQSLRDRLDAIEDEDEDEDECPTCSGSGQRATARTANGSELERHERSGTPCDDCGGTGTREDGDDA
jgi:hypothetical protein